MHSPTYTHTHMQAHIHTLLQAQRTSILTPHYTKIQTSLLSFWSLPAPFCSTNFYTSIFSSEWPALGGEIWSGDLLHVSLGDSQGVNYVGDSGQPYLWEACQVFRCWSEMCGLNRLLRCKSGHAGHVCLAGVCLRVCACVWGLVFAGRLSNAGL